MTPILYAFNLLFTGSCALALFTPNRERHLTLSLLQALTSLPLLAGLYAYFGHFGATHSMVELLLLSENIFAVLWLGLA